MDQIDLAISDTSSGKQARPEKAIKAPRPVGDRIANTFPMRPYQLPPRCQTASPSNEITLHRALSLEFFWCGLGV